MYSDVDFRLLVRKIRQTRRLTQEQFAQELHVTFSTVNGWENGRHAPIPALANRLIEIATELGIKPKGTKKSNWRSSTPKERKQGRSNVISR